MKKVADDIPAYTYGSALQPLEWSVITGYIDPRSHTMAALYGNDAAMHAARARSNGSSETTVAAPGSVLALVTPAQREDPHWFGGRIPDTPKSVEFLQADASGTRTTYQCYDGPGLVEHGLSADVAEKRTKFISNLAPAWLR